MRASRKGNQIALGVLIAIAAAGVTALAFRLVPAAAGAGGSTYVSSAAAAGPRDTVTVIGEGEQLAAPDIAILNIGVQPHRGTVRDATNTANNEMTKLLANIKAKGVADQDIQTNSLGISPYNDCSFGPCRMNGFQAVNSVVVKVHHLGNVGTIVAAAADAAGDDIQLNGVSLDLSDRASQLAAARTAAMASASTKAKHWASLAGRHLGKVLSVSEVVSNGTAQPACSGGCGGGGAPVQAGQSSVLVDVTVVYELTD